MKEVVIVIYVYGEGSQNSDRGTVNEPYSISLLTAQTVH